MERTKSRGQRELRHIGREGFISNKGEGDVFRLVTGEVTHSVSISEWRLHDDHEGETEFRQHEI